MQINKQPLVSIIMNCHNGEAYLSKSIQSVLSQNYKNWELIFWDNSSNDNSKKILQEFSDKRIKYFKADHFTKLYQARNLAIKKCSGSFISFLDVDDWWVPEKLELQINYFKNEDDIGLVYSKYLIYNQKTKNKKLVANNNLPEGYITEHLLEEYKIGILTVMIKRELLDEFNVYFNPEYNIIGDFDFNIKLSKQVKFGCIQKPLAFYRLHGENLSLKNLNEEIKELEHWAKNQFISDKKNTKVSNKMNNLILYKKIYLNISENKRFTALKKIFTYPNNFLKVKLIILLFTPLFMLKRFNVLG
jgi:glycosyltransferase involved in cell wall biosynthesis